jgi:hypothetical protein
MLACARIASMQTTHLVVGVAAIHASNHDAHGAESRPVMALLQPVSLQQDGEEQREAAQRNEHGHVEPCGACSTQAE